ncbi:MAG TPA: HD domain-containing protein [bacterium]|nr:HD domain-containing protein [bacterium]HOL35643.1 HD domain-containing protein [bacterium]HPP07643.1 HD domain-containing protein [bacterium]
MLKHQKELLKAELLSIAMTCSATIDAEQLTLIFDHPDLSTSLERTLKKIINDIPSVSSIYILTRQGAEHFLVVAGANSETGTELSRETSNSADKFPGILMGFAVPFVSEKGNKPGFLTGYAPVRDANGTPVAVLKIDYDIRNTTGMRHTIYLQIIGTSIVLIILVVLFGFFISHQISVPVNDLVEGIKNIQRGNFEYRIPLRNNDEFGQLARTFNQMTTGLVASQKMLQSYLYRTIRSFVTILEARDSYTKGHSERVAFFSEKIATRMGLPEKKIKILRETALLHDIGKFGIGESILQKTEPLTEDEWNIIKAHPVVGEEILRPLLLEKDALEIVRQHHERFDGTGYPDGLNRNNINLLAQILAVADAFDAMTSARSYRKPLSIPEAIKELKENGGTQFNPDIVNVLMKILEEEMHIIVS